MSLSTDLDNLPIETLIRAQMSNPYSRRKKQVPFRPPKVEYNSVAIDKVAHLPLATSKMKIEIHDSDSPNKDKSNYKSLSPRVRPQLRRKRALIEKNSVAIHEIATNV